MKETKRTQPSIIYVLVNTKNINLNTFSELVIFIFFIMLKIMNFKILKQHFLFYLYFI